MRILQTAAAAADGVGHGLDRFVLADHPLVQPLFEHQQLGPLGFHHATHGHAGPRADHLGDLFGTDFLAQQPPAGLGRAVGALLRLGLFQMPRQLLLLHVELVQLLEGRFVDQLAGRLVFLDHGRLLLVLVLGLFQSAADLGHVAQAQLLAFPLLAEAGQATSQLGHLFVDLGQPLLGMLFGLVLQLPGRQLQLNESTLHLVDLRRHAL